MALDDQIAALASKLVLIRRDPSVTAEDFMRCARLWIGELVRQQLQHVRKPLTAEQRAEIIRRYDPARRGSVRALAAEFGVSRQYVYQLLRAAGALASREGGGST